ncbi:hypothetical protein LTR56_017907 [Elasticomyces elasticus]|nr:hypothetical protein LTR22_022814 [Elasticomyces elasticus]KAK3629602.1 hypothetical protein LTR56_017907 [Elasticomyces elasticus]KAK4907582.1 hypothetical protein LTR49_023393 [Elasticomyces elasticus]KAK5766233.1 hypothetical protein LTS12_003717 [Elasticomyces elasticus]
MADSDDSDTSRASSDIVQDPLDLAESWEGDGEDLDIVENIVRDKMRGQIRDEPQALKMSIAILKCGIDEPFHRARFNFYISLLSLLSAERGGVGESAQPGYLVAQRRREGRNGQAEEVDPPVQADHDVGEAQACGHANASHTHSHIHDHSYDHDHDSAPSALSPKFGLDGTSELSPAGLDGPSEIPATDMGRDGTGQPHPDLSFTSISERNEEHEPSPAEVAAKERLAANIAALKEGRTKEKNPRGNLGKLR